MGCWEDEGRPWLASELAKQWAPAFAAANHFGALHIVVEDWNLDDDDIAFCRASTVDPADIALADALQKMSVPERWACAILSEEPAFSPIGKG